VVRGRYDSWLASKAAEAGAEVREHHRVVDVKRLEPMHYRVKAKHKGELRELDCRAVVGADGFPSLVASKLGFPKPSTKDFAASIQYHIQLTEEQVDSEYGDRVHFYFGVVKWGYAWAFPKRTQVAAGILSVASEERLQSLKAKLDGVLGLEKLRNVVRVEKHLIPHRLRPRLQLDCALLVGDTAGAANPVHWGGIWHARKTAEVAARNVARALEQENPAASAYEHEMRREVYAPYFRYDLVMQKMMYGMGLMRRALALAAEGNMDVIEAIDILLTSLEPHSKAFWKLLKAAPRLLLKA